MPGRGRAPGQSIGLVGESGCGKATTARCMLRAIEPTAGEILMRVTGGAVVEIGRLGRTELRALRREMQMIFQDPFSSLNPRMTLLDLVGEPLLVHSVKRCCDVRAIVRLMASVIGPHVPKRRWRRAEYDRLVDLGIFVGEHLELLDGMLAVREPQGSSHAAIVGQIGKALRAAFGAGWHVRLQAPLALDDASEAEPDVVVVAGEHRDYLGGHLSTAALVVEVADSSLGLDRRLKVDLFARAGLAEYWIANLVEGVLEVHREPCPEPDTAYGWVYRSVEILRSPASVTPLGATGSLIPVADLLP